MKVKLMLDGVKFYKKPSSYETSEIQKRLVQTEIEIEELAIGLCNGMTCKPALLNGSKSSNWIQQQIFMLDFDNDTTIDAQLNRCDELGIIPSFIYTSFSHTEVNHHFRLVFINDTVIEDINKRNRLQSALISAFNKSDKVTFDPTRIFFGGNGKLPIKPNYKIKINGDDIISRFYVDDSGNIKPKKINKYIKPNSNKSDVNLHTESIKSLNVSVMKTLLFGEVLGVPNKEEYNNLILSGTIKTPLYSENEVYEYINSIDMHSFLGINHGEMIKCILPNHDDNSPSAHIYTTNNGTQIYKCFGCNQSLTLIGLVEELANCKRHEAINFIKNVYGIELMQSDWALEQKQLLIDSAKYLDYEEFKIQFPYIHKLIRTRKTHIQSMLLHFTDFISDEMKYNNKPVFFASYNTLMDICGIDKTRSKTIISQSLILFTLLNMLEKVELENIPEKELKKAKAISAKYGFKKLTSFYQFEEYGRKTLKDSEKIAKVLIDNNISLKGLSREYVLRTFGIDICNNVFPQFVYENNKGTSEKSNNKTLELATKAINIIDEKGYILEKDIRGNGETELQWKKSIQEILDTYGLKRIRLNKEIKDYYGITGNGYPFIICR